MFKKYIRDVVKSELSEKELNLFYDTMMSENYWKQVYHNQLDYTEKTINKKDKEISELENQVERLKFQNYKLCELCENSSQKEVLKGNLLSEKLSKIEEIIDVEYENEITYLSLLNVFMKIRNIIKES